MYIWNTDNPIHNSWPSGITQVQKWDMEGQIIPMRGLIVT